MNEKIKQLRNTAGIQVVRTLMRGDENTEVKLMLTQTQLEKFAELIVGECADMLDKMAELPDDIGGNTYLRIASKEIKQRFGVNE
jgi:hypothetical protein